VPRLVGARRDDDSVEVDQGQAVRDWRATTHHPNRRSRWWRLATKIDNRFTAWSEILWKNWAEFP
jgi:hypothetical protein